MSISLEIQDLRVHAGEIELVRGVSFVLPAGGVINVVGESGSGKSVMAQALFGALPRELSTSGRVVVHGQASDAADERARRPLWGKAIALLPQEPWQALDPTMPILSQVAEGRALTAGKPDSRAWARTQLEKVGLGRSLKAYPHTLSGGMAQRAAMAAARGGGAPLLVVDEPTKGLDAPLRDQVAEQLKAVQAESGAVLLITHDVHLARMMGGETLVVLGGEVVERGPTAEVLSHPRHAFTRALVAAAPEAWPARPAPAPSGDGPLIRARSLSKRLGGKQLFDGLDLDIGAGERLAITGPSGSGKTTLGAVLLGLRRPDAGEVVRSPALKRTDVQKLYQDPGAAFAAHASLGRSLSDVMELHGVPAERLPALMDRVGLTRAQLARRPEALSGGELQRFSLVRVLMLQPKVLFADEPTSRLDPISQRAAFDLLMEVVDETGMALVLVTHDPEIAGNLCGRTLALTGA